jgi:hypothetical protein
VFGIFVGTTPGSQSIRQLLQISSDPEPEVIRWKLTLYQEEKTLASAGYQLRCDYGLTAPGEPGMAKGIKTLERQGVWTRSQGSKSNPAAQQIDDNVLHVLNPDRSLMIGNGGWSYSLNRAERAEELVDPALSRFEPDMSYRISALATGPAVAGVFEGRSPCRGIARQLRIPSHPACLKAKWRVTLYQNPETLTPTIYRIEGTFFRRGAVEGTWAHVRTRNGAGPIVYRLTPGSNGTALYLLKGDDNVLFFLDQKEQLLVGNLYFSYTLNRRAPPRPS